MIRLVLLVCELGWYACDLSNKYFN
jgi:hypothetical protein